MINLHLLWKAIRISGNRYTYVSFKKCTLSCSRAVELVYLKKESNVVITRFSRRYSFCDYHCKQCYIAYALHAVLVKTRSSNGV